LKGHIRRIPNADGLKIPHVGWNSLRFPKESKLFHGIAEDSYVYFVHSYYLEAENLDDVAATTEYGVHIHAACEQENVFACQFHPEKSSAVGLKIIDNFLHV
jgi:glutamine amidotransferase